MMVMGLPEETKTAPSLQSQIWAGISTGSNRTVQKKFTLNTSTHKHYNVYCIIHTE